MLIAVLALQGSDPLRIAPGTAILPGIGLAILLAGAVAGRRTGRPQVAAVASGFLQMTLFTLLGVILSYVIAARAGALWDAELAAWDGALGFDWPALRAVVDRQPALVWLLGIAYHSLIPQMIVVIVALGKLTRYDVLRVTLRAAILSGFVTILLSGLLPARGNLFDADAYRHLWAPIAWHHADVIAGLRDGTLRVLDLRDMMGIVTFPSYHATLAVIFIWAFQHILRLRWAGTLWASLTILATPLAGGHYAVDVIAGILLAVAGIAAVRLAARHAPQRTWGYRASRRRRRPSAQRMPTLR